MATPEEQRPAHQKHPLAKMIALGIVASAIGIAICLWIDWFPAQGSTAAEDIDTLWDVLLIVSVPIFVLVMTIAIYCVIAFRAKPGEMGDGAHIHGNTRLEVVWVTIPFLIVSALAVYSWIVLDDIEAKQDRELVVDVTGQQFSWTFDYKTEKVKSTELVLPIDRPVFFKIHANDVLHSFWVPEFRMKQDAVPGLTTETRATPTKIGEYEVVCTELCGIGHATMRNKVRVVPEEEWEAWVEEQAGGGAAEEEADDPAAAGRQLFTATGCGSCHTFSDADSTAEIGPNLDELADVAGDRKPRLDSEGYVEEAIVDPAAFAVDGFDGNIMPKTYGEDLTPEEIDTLVQYLLGLTEAK